MPGPAGLDSKPLPAAASRSGGIAGGGDSPSTGSGAAGADAASGEPDGDEGEVLIDSRFGKAIGSKSSIDDFDLLKVSA